MHIHYLPYWHQWEISGNCLFVDQDHQPRSTLSKHEHGIERLNVKGKGNLKLFTCLKFYSSVAFIIEQWWNGKVDISHTWFYYYTLIDFSLLNRRMQSAAKILNFAHFFAHHLAASLKHWKWTFHIMQSVMCWRKCNLIFHLITKDRFIIQEMTKFRF